MDRDGALEIVEKKLKGPRFQHTLGVVSTAVKLAEKYGANQKQAEIAAIFHDYAKLFPINELKNILVEAKADDRLLLFHPELWHGPAAAYILKKEFSIDNEDIINAIRFHTTGRANMTLLEKIIYLADYIEPGRSFPGVEETRELAEIDLDQAVFKAINNTISFLIRKNAAIFPDTFEAYNSFVLNKGGNTI
ncbi:bis(5'-nucleosyl)-tetraphosphatase (symmetrical) YqeK [Bacillus sp. FJAT-49711]|uniref:bis(5'-nucleosyl)-tetraphosphatase (symmetrical) YqeK n=1 Tax=Bacillus sp. FJAT-49711 TaxID=2833585 RepID=UPI001BC8D9F8|nr:bis(5'-nucleosyl)-tetraphosphatase (symmetrical) YqeK [Bacillus sp. FJAT-49711]MBS4217080.1 bis(5'-nucleosyl)-tetraphosphatase (symmetrical) YqeK [Bacillus sp. FJAT-49711]